LDPILTFIIIILGTVGGTVIGFFLRKKFVESKLATAEEAAKKIFADAKKDSDTLKKEARLQAKEELYKSKAEFEKESRNKKYEMQKIEKRLSQKEENLEKKVNLLDQKDISIAKREKSLEAREKNTKEMEDKYSAALDEQKSLLEKISGMTSTEAKKHLMQNLENEAKLESARTIRRIEEEPKRIRIRYPAILLRWQYKDTVLIMSQKRRFHWSICPMMR